MCNHCKFNLEHKGFCKKCGEEICPACSSSLNSKIHQKCLDKYKHEIESITKRRPVVPTKPRPVGAESGSIQNGNIIQTSTRSIKIPIIPRPEGVLNEIDGDILLLWQQNYYDQIKPRALISSPYSNVIEMDQKDSKATLFNQIKATQTAFSKEIGYRKGLLFDPRM